MDIASDAAAISAMKQSEVQAQVSMKVLKMAMDTQEAMALQMLEALPDIPAPAVGSTSGGHVDIYA